MRKHKNSFLAISTLVGFTAAFAASSRLSGSSLATNSLPGVLASASEDISLELPCTYNGSNWPPECVFGFNVYKYSGPGAIFSSLTDAINQADTLAQSRGHACVEILSGTYSEDVLAAGIENVTVFGHGYQQGSSSETVVRGRLNFGGFHNLTIDNLRIDAQIGGIGDPNGLTLFSGVDAEVRRVHVSLAVDHGVLIHSSSNVYLHHLITRDNGTTGVGSGIAIYFSDAVVVECSLAHANHGQGIEVDSSSNIYINGNRSQLNCDTGIGISDLSSRCYPDHDVAFSAGCDIVPICSIGSSNIHVTYNESLRNASAGVGSDGARGLYVHNNRIHDNGAITCNLGASKIGIYLITTYDFVISGNTIFGNHQCAAIVVNKCANGSVYSNAVTGLEIAGMNSGVSYPTAQCGHIFADLSTTTLCSNACDCVNSCEVPYIGCGGWMSSYNPYTDANQNFLNCCRCGGTPAPTATFTPSPTVTVTGTLPPTGAPLVCETPSVSPTPSPPTHTPSSKTITPPPGLATPSE